jgi:prepilin-type processing-associated H-X9-DG protein
MLLRAEPLDPPPDWDGQFLWEYGGGMRRACTNRHNGGVHVLFMDWSLAKVSLKDLWTLKWHRSFDTSNAWTAAGGVVNEDWPRWMRTLD